MLNKRALKITAAPITLTGDQALVWTIEQGQLTVPYTTVELARELILDPSQSLGVLCKKNKVNFDKLDPNSRAYLSDLAYRIQLQDEISVGMVAGIGLDILKTIKKGRPVPSATLKCLEMLTKMVAAKEGVLIRTPGQKEDNGAIRVIIKDECLPSPQEAKQLPHDVIDIQPLPENKGV